MVKVESRTIKIDNFIDRVTRFRPNDFEYSEKFIEGEWDGWIHLYNAAKGLFPVGLLQDVQMMLLVQEVPFETIDERKYRKFAPLPIAYYSSLRDYQVEAIVKSIEAKRAVICLPTGSGKTLCGIALTAELKLPTVFFVHKKELLYQTKEAYEKAFGDKKLIGQVGDGIIDLKPITVAMVQTASRLPQQLFSDYGLVIFDECHHTPADTVYDIAKHIESEYVIGLSATPRREDGKEMLIWAGTGPICYNITTSEMINKGYLAKPFIDFIEVEPLAFKKGLKYQDIYRIAIVHNEDRNTKIALKAVELAVKGKVYIHVRQVAHGEQLCMLINELLPANVRQAEFIYGEDTTQTRNKVIDAFKNRDLRILVSTLLGEGVDLPEMYALILASGGLSRTFIQQVFGRLLRISQHKEVEFWDCNDPFKHLYDHWLERVRFYKSEPAFVLSPKIEAIDVPDKEDE
jgi:superfamily II DNA or RNA helicase